MLNNIFNVCVGTSFKVIRRKTLFVYFEGCVLYCASVAVCVCVCVRARVRACVCVGGGGGGGLASTIFRLLVLRLFVSMTLAVTS